MVDIKQGPLATLQQHRLTGIEGVVEHERRVGDIGPQWLGVLQQLLRDRIDVQLTAIEDLHQRLILVDQRTLDLLAQDGRVEEILDADADARDLVHVRRPDAATRRADLGLAEESLRHLVECHVVRRNEVGAGADEQA